jgi:hypothetical protein
MSDEMKYRMANSICGTYRACNCPEDEEEKEEKKKMKDTQDQNFTNSIDNIQAFQSSMSVSTLSYGVPFFSNKIYFDSPCECKKLKKARTLCSEMEKVDILFGKNRINLTGIILDNDKTSPSIPKIKSSHNNLRFKEKMNTRSCNCLNDEDRISLFCEDKCHVYRRFLENINYFYNSQLQEANNYFESRIKLTK